MRSYLIDELSPDDMKKLKGFLKQDALKSQLESIFWMRVPEDLLSAVQFQHRDCRPHVFAVELGTQWIKVELFIRSLRGLNCECQAYCTSAQRAFILDFADRAIGDLQVRT
jgi:hypothetical protein